MTRKHAHKHELEQAERNLSYLSKLKDGLLLTYLTREERLEHFPVTIFLRNRTLSITLYDTGTIEVWWQTGGSHNYGSVHGRNPDPTAYEKLNEVQLSELVDACSAYFSR